MTTFAKRELTDAAAKRCGVTQNQALAVVQDVLDNIRVQLLAGNRVELRHFGVFEVKSRKPRVARNPKTGEMLRIPQRYSVTFKPGLLMKAWEGKTNVG